MKSIAAAAPLGVLLAGALVLTGCPASMVVTAMTGPNVIEGHTPNAGDYASWIGVPQAQLETHSRFSLLPREVRPVSDGSELWLLRYCPKKSRVSASDCCMYEFVVQAKVVTSYRTAGTCAVDCAMRPESKVQACINAAIVPDGYGAHYAQ